MKQVAFILILIFYTNTSLFSQALVDPYKLYYDPINVTTPMPSPSYGVMRNNQSIPVYNSSNQDFYFGSTAFDGEYMIILKPGWTPSGNWVDALDYWHYVLKKHAISYEIELVSFPFCMPDCWESTGCAGTTDRKLKMPIASYSNNKWGLLNRIRENGNLYPNDPNPLYVKEMKSGAELNDNPETLVSAQFLSNSSAGTSRNYLPHSILTHRLFIHCTLSLTSDIIDTISWTYDLTRGRMRYYPFHFENTNVGGGSNIDVMYIPELLIKPEDNYYLNQSNLVEHEFEESSNSPWIDGGVLNYMDISIEPSNCNNSNYFPASLPDNFYTYGNEPLYGLPPWNSLLNASLRSGHGTTLAGYSYFNPGIYIPNNNFVGMKQDYFINSSINLYDINTTQKEIYNPSEVSIDPDAGDPQGQNLPIEVIFPEGYTFKTILGRYPSYQQVLDASNDPQNGSYNYLREVPVPVDAATRPWSTTDPDDYPEVMWDNPNTSIVYGFYGDERFGYYYIQDKATLTISKCVKIFDARFAVYPGGTMRFNDYSQILGFEDFDNNYGRYKIRGEGGAILRNHAPVQYVQNGNIFQSIPLNYIATSQIIAGENVDPDTDQPSGIYEIKAGADVTFTAGDFIHLKDGFYVSGGDFHAVIDENMGNIPFCNQLINQNGNRISENRNTVKELFSNETLIISPNPNKGSFTISINGSTSINDISLFDDIGRLIYNQSNLHVKSHDIQLGSDKHGLILAKVVNEKGNVKVLKW